MNTFFKLLLDFSLWAGAIQVIGGLVISGYVTAALVCLIPKGNIGRARLLVAEGVIAGLTLMVAATMLKTIALQTSRQILMLGVILSLRLLLKKLFDWERRRLLARLEACGTPRAEVASAMGAG